MKYAVGSECTTNWSKIKKEHYWVTMRFLTETPCRLSFLSIYFLFLSSNADKWIMLSCWINVEGWDDCTYINVFLLCLLMYGCLTLICLVKMFSYEKVGLKYLSSYSILQDTGCIVDSVSLVQNKCLYLSYFLGYSYCIFIDLVQARTLDFISSV